MSFDISALSAVSSAVGALGGIAAILPEDEGYKAQGPDRKLDEPLIFEIVGDESLQLNSDITNHAVEDNTVLNDQIAVQPEVFTVGGYVGELSNVLPRVLKTARKAQEKLILISGFLPELTTDTLRALNAAEQAYFTAQNATRIIKSLITKGATAQTKQEEVLQRIYSYWRDKTLFTIITPWGKFTDMAIQSVRANQEERTISESNFTITFKKMRFAKTSYRQNNNQYGRLSSQGALVQNNGIRAGESSSLTLSGIF